MPVAEGGGKRVFSCVLLRVMTGIVIRLRTGGGGEMAPTGRVRRYFGLRVTRSPTFTLI